jgi:hypothetical protein
MYVYRYMYCVYVCVHGCGSTHKFLLGSWYDSVLGFRVHKRGWTPIWFVTRECVYMYVLYVRSAGPWMNKHTQQFFGVERLRGPSSRFRYTGAS